jgi:uncharacterized membrane protein YhaH (DUF805 family)
MARAGAESDFRFLYRQSEGVIGPTAWARASAPPVAITIALTLVAWAIAPDTPRDLGSQDFADIAIVATHVYFLAYAFALILCAVAEYFVSAKRFADRGKPAELAGLAPFALLVAAAANWYQPRSEGTMPAALTWVFDAVAVGVVVWNVIELGFGASRRQ